MLYDRLVLVNITVVMVVGDSMKILITEFISRDSRTMNLQRHLD